MSELLLEQMLKAGGLEALTFLIVHELSHLVKEHLPKNLMQSYAYGDLRKQLFFFTNEYTGYDALLVDHFTNTRYTLEQEQEADELAFVILRDLDLLSKTTDSNMYRQILKAVQEQGEDSDDGTDRKEREHRRLLQAQQSKFKVSKADTEKARRTLDELQLKVKEVRKVYVEKEAERKAERAKAKKARDYEIFTEMPYKLSSRKFKLGERHPVSKKRFEAATEVLASLTEGVSGSDEVKTGAVSEIERILRCKTEKVSFVRI